MLNKGFMVLLCCATLAYAKVSQEDAMNAIPYIARDDCFQTIIDYVSCPDNQTALVPVHLAMQERKQQLMAWRDGYYRNYTLPWFMLHCFQNLVVGGSLTVVISGGAFCLDKNAAQGVFVIGLALTGMFILKNSVNYTVGWGSGLSYYFDNVDLQITRLDSILSIIPSLRS